MCVFPKNVCLSDPDLLMARNDPMMGWCSSIWTERWMRRKARGCVCLSSSVQLWNFIKLHKAVSISLQGWWRRVVGGKRGHLGWIYQPLGLGPVVWERQSASGMARHGRPEPRVQGREGVTRHENGRLPFEHVRQRGTNKHKGGCRALRFAPVSAAPSRDRVEWVCVCVAFQFTSSCLSSSTQTPLDLQHTRRDRQTDRETGLSSWWCSHWDYIELSISHYRLRQITHRAHPSILITSQSSCEHDCLHQNEN